MSRHLVTPFATRRVLRGLALALRLAEAKAARDQTGDVAPDLPRLTVEEADDIARARAWLDEAVRARKVVPESNGRRSPNRMVEQGDKSGDR